VARNRYRQPGGVTYVDTRQPALRKQELIGHRLRAVEGAIVRLEWGFDPIGTIKAWAAKQKPAMRMLGKPTRVAGPELASLFPGRLVYTLLIPAPPVVRFPPPPGALPRQNIFFLDAKGQVQHISGQSALEGFFKANLPPVKTEEAAAAATKAWLRLGSVLANDGYYRFVIRDKDIRVTKTEGAIETVGRARVDVPTRGRRPGPMIGPAGNSGFVGVRMKFGAEGKLLTVRQIARLRPGVRPICQSTKLLSPDPIVRAMAERDLRVMGRLAENYLMTMRRTGAPELRAAIDRIWQQILADEGRLWEGSGS